MYSRPDVLGACSTVMFRGMVLCKVVHEVVFTFLPVDEELTLFDSIPDPVESHVHCFGSLLLDGVVGDAAGACVVCFDWGGWLWVA